MSNNTTIAVIAAIAGITIVAVIWSSGWIDFQYLKRGYIERWSPVAQHYEWTYDTNRPNATHLDIERAP